MNDEIKEILDKLKDGNWYNELDLTGEMWIELRWKETHLLLDLITNLQQANKSLTEQLEYLRSGEYLNQVKWERDLNENLNQTMSIELINYKSRCEKINEILKESPDFNYSNDYIILKRKIEGILQGENNE